VWRQVLAFDRTPIIALATANVLIFAYGVAAAVPRYTLLLFPLFLIPGRLARRGRWPLVVLVPSIGLLCFLVGRLVLGQWAF
jgi:hypothetical protein